MAVNEKQMQKLDNAMREYYEAVYRSSHAAYKGTGFSLDARRAVISDAELFALRDRVTSLVDGVNEATFTRDAYVVQAIEKEAQKRANLDSDSGVKVESGLKAGLKAFTKSSLDIVAEIDDYNITGRGRPTEISHRDLLEDVRSRAVTTAPVTLASWNAKAGKAEPARTETGVPAATAAAATSAVNTSAPVNRATDKEISRAAYSQVLEGTSKPFREGVSALLVEASTKAKEALGRPASRTERMAVLADSLAGIPEKGKTDEETQKYSNMREAHSYAIAALSLADIMSDEGTVRTFGNAGSEKFRAAALKQGQLNIPVLNHTLQAASGGSAEAASKPARISAEERKAIIERNAGRYAEIDPALQAKLEAKGLPTGQRAGVDVTDASQLDGILGEKTKDSIEKVLGRAITIPLDEATVTELNGKLDAMESVAAQGASAAPAVVEQSAAAPAQPLPGQEAAAAAMAKSTKREDDNNYKGYVSDAQDVAGMLDMAKVTLSKSQIERIKITNADNEAVYISGPDILKLEKALNAIRGTAPAFNEDGKWDARLTELVRVEGVKEFVQAIFDGQTVAAASGPGTTPGQGNGGAKAQGQ